MKKLLFSFIFLAVSLLTYSQKTITYAEPDAFYYKDFSIIIKNIVSQKDYTKFRIKIINNTDAVIIYKPKETYVVYSDRKEYSSTKEISISPNDKEPKTIVFNRSKKNHKEKSIAIVIDGLYVKRNSFKNGEVVVKRKKLPKIAYNFTEDHSEIISLKK